MSGAVILTVSNRKGGSGKSTTVVNLAAEWAGQGRRTLVVDLDTQGHAGHGLGVEARRGAPTAHDLFREGTRGYDLLDSAVPTAWSGLACVPADQLFDGTGCRPDTRALAAQLRRPEVSDRFDVVILDTPPSLDLVLTSAMIAADGVLIPLIPHALSAEGVSQLSRLFFRVAVTANPGLKLLGLLPVMVNPRVNHHRTVLDDLAHRFGREKLLRGVRMDIALAEAFAVGQPVREVAPRSRGALDYFLLADELARLWNWPPVSTKQRVPA